MLIKDITYQQALPIRQKVLKPYLSLEECINPGDLKPDSFHLGAFVDGQLTGIASFEFENSPNFPIENQVRLRGMAVIPEYQKHGTGKLLILSAEKKIKERNSNFLWCNARQIAYGFYLSLGFQFFGETFEIQRIGPHKVMYKSLNS